jgi:crotonobetainyl-CoA:carnitine CoA-transferase CaiB-like acyl-CoA transferase
MRHYRGNDLVGAAMSGFMHLNGFPEDPPNQPGGEQAYHLASLVAASSLLVALCGRDRRPGGAGHRIDVSIQEAASMVTLQTANATAYTWYGTVPGRRGLDVPGGRNLFECADGLWVRFVVHPPHWDKFVAWLDEEGIDSVIKAPGWRDQGYRVEHPEPIVETMKLLASRLTRDEAFHKGQSYRVMALPVNTVADLVADEQLASRDFFVEYEQPALGRNLKDAGFVPKLSATPMAFRRPAPRLGEHNDAVYGDLLGVPTDERQRLREAGVI